MTIPPSGIIVSQVTCLAEKIRAAFPDKYRTNFDQLPAVLQLNALLKKYSG